MLIYQSNANLDEKILFGEVTHQLDQEIPGKEDCAKDGGEEFFYRDASRSNRPFSYSTKESGSSDIFIHFYTRGSIEWR